MAEQTTPKRALVLSGGGGRGAFQAGVFEHLESIGWKPDIIVGTSIGSMNAAVYAVGGVANLQQMWESIRTKDMHRFFRWKPWNSVFDRAPWKRTLEEVCAGRSVGADQDAAVYGGDRHHQRPSHGVHQRRKTGAEQRAVSESSRVDSRALAGQFEHPLCVRAHRDRG